MEFNNIAVIGAGLMGSGIAQVVAQAGYYVSVHDIEPLCLDKAKAKIVSNLQKATAKGRLSEVDARAVLDRISFTSKFEDAIGDADYIIEAVPESRDLKQIVFKELDRKAKDTAILASNTSELSIGDIASSTSKPERVIGTHWFYPPQVMRLIEVVKGDHTSDATLRATLNFCSKLGKETVVCKDATGFITSRAISALIAECMRIYEDGIASVEDIDKAMRLGFNHPIGPFQLVDMSGVDVVCHALEGLSLSYGERFAPGKRMRELLKKGRLGQKTGQGFYKYDV